jgi:23S rRNA (cytosine1962-C5)-methyltransferase
MGLFSLDKNNPFLFQLIKGNLMNTKLTLLLEKSLQPRLPLLDEDHHSALRLFTGFYEGELRLVVDVYASTLLLTSYNESGAEGSTLMDEAQGFYLKRLPWLTCAVQKQRRDKNEELKRGRITFGGEPAAEILENGLRYAVDLCLNQDASFYLDTRNLRSWLKENSRGLSVLNTFAYTGSLGIASLAGGAAKVIQVDLGAHFLELARRSAMLNRLDLGRMKLRAADVFSEIGRFKKEGHLFDMVLLDPPFFSVTDRGKVDLVGESTRIINKLRPLINDGGRLISINNALFLPGQEYMQSLQALCQDGYLEIEQIIPIPEDITGFPETVTAPAPADPAPFNHPTKIVMMRVRRKDAKITAQKIPVSPGKSYLLK